MGDSCHLALAVKRAQQPRHSNAYTPGELPQATQGRTLGSGGLAWRCRRAWRSAAAAASASPALCAPCAHALQLSKAAQLPADAMLIAETAKHADRPQGGAVGAPGMTRLPPLSVLHAALAHGSHKMLKQSPAATTLGGCKACTVPAHQG